MAQKTDNKTKHGSIQIIILLLISSGLIFAAVIVPFSKTLSNQSLQVGNVANEDIIAPTAINYTSEVLTEQKRQIAANAVAPVYTRADTDVARRQLEHIRAALAYISSVRADKYATTEQKLTDLAALQDISLSHETAIKIIELNDTRWQVIQQESIVVLEQVMRNTIRENRLEDARRSVPNLVSLSLPEEQAAIVAEIVSAFVAPNSFYSENQTEIARQKAAESVTPVTKSYAKGETILSRGQVVTAEDIEALEKLGLAQPERKWQDIVSSAALVILSIIVIIIYVRRRENLFKGLKDLIVISILFIVFLFGARLVFPLHSLAPYLYPLIAFTLTTSALFGIEPAIVFSAILIILATFDSPNALELILYHFLGGILGILVSRKEQRITSYIWIGIAVAMAGAIVVLVIHLPENNIEWINLTTLETSAILNGMVASGLSFLLRYFLAPILGLTTPLQLLELSRPDRPLLEFLLRNAPGTYQHSLQVANLAEQAAERIGANSLLTRVGALYHDIGKALNPQFFIENQVQGSVNTHDDLSPSESAALIISHITNGLELAKEYKLPKRIQDFIAEHHGTMITKYQFAQAVKQANGDASLVDSTLFQYPGPRPQSRETALVMLADGCEARVRAVHPSNDDELEEIIKDTINNRLSEGQLMDTDLTLKNLKTISESFKATLRGIYHPRIEYPNLESPVPSSEQPTLQQPRSQITVQTNKNIEDINADQKINEIKP